LEFIWDLEFVIWDFHLLCNFLFEEVMEMGAPWNGPLEKIDDYRFRISKGYKQGMRVDGIIYSDEKMLQEIRQDQAAEQVANVAFLPGIVKSSLAMPDIHWGYGFCVTKDTKVLTNLGFYKPIGDFEEDFFVQNIKCMDLHSQKAAETPILRFIKLEPKEVFRILTKGGYEIKATEDHPFFTPSGMQALGELSFGQKVAISPFQGVAYEEPSNEIIISEEDIRRTLLKMGRKPNTPKFEIVLQKLKERNLLSLSYTHSKLPYILKIMGFVFGDGSMNFIGKRGDGVLHFSGKPQDLEEVRRDLRKIGYTPGPLHFPKVKDSRGSNKYYDCCSFLVNASSLVVLLEALGVPRGSKVAQAYRIPKWIFKASLWQKRLFLATLFGCELRIPHKRLQRRGYFNAPVFPMAKREELLDNGKDFLNDISRVLEEFGVKTLYIVKRRRHINRKGEASWALELLISLKPENLFNLWSRIGFEYNFKRAFMANVAVQYLKLKLKILEEKERAIGVTIPQLLKDRLSYQKIAYQLAGNPLTKRFIIDICWKLNKGKKIIPRIPFSFPPFEDYLAEVTQGLESSGMVWDEIAKIEKIPCRESVYDFTVEHASHNFIANNFVVSNCIGGVAATNPKEGGVISPGGVGYDINCGVRLVKTHLLIDEVKPKIKELTSALFNTIPAGVGSTGDIRISVQEERALLVKGSHWAVEKGYGIKDDLECTEEQGCIEGANPEDVSDRAYERGKKQSGTLGSGNHFLEIQEVERIYDRGLADRFGLREGQITIMIHSGSRGLGYQVCDDYLEVMGKAVHKYNISLPDRQLACAPVESPEARAYISAMRCAANYAWANRQCLMHLARLVFEGVFNKSWEALGMYLIYDVAHNIAKFEKYNIDGKEKTLCVHRKGATRAFGPGHPELPQRYKDTGQPVIIPGDMGRNSFLLVGTAKAEETFYSTCFTGDTRIITDKGIVTLKEIYEFNKLGLTYNALSINKNTLSTEWKPILGVSKRRGSAVRISVSQTNRSRFSTLDTTLDHKFSIFENAEINFENNIEKIINSQKMICALDRLETPWKLHHPRLAFLMGALVTDGYIDKKQKRVVFTQKKAPEKLNFIDYIRDSFRLVFEHELNEGKTKYGGGIIRGKLMGGTATDFTIGRKFIIEEILDIVENLDTWVLGLNRESTLNFLSGVIDGDGTWNPTHGVIDIFNSKERVVGAVVLACLKLGILPYISIQRDNCYIIQISEKLEEILRFTKRVKGIPHRQKYGSKLFSVRQLFTENWISGNIRWPFKRKADRNNLMEGDKILEFLAWQSSSRYNRDKIIQAVKSPLRMQRLNKIMDLGINDLYNIDVQDNHNYFVFTKTFMPILVKNCHGAGRVMSRTQAIKSCSGRHISRELEEKGIIVMASSPGTLAEEIPEAYKDVNAVVKVVAGAGISKIVCRMRPLGVIKG
jgi:tRNA-splicing ligase RtcB